MFNFLKPRSVSGIPTDSDRLFLTAKDGIKELVKIYKPVPDNGKFEIILFNSLTVLRVYRENNLSKYASIEEGFYKLIFNQAKEYNIRFSIEQLRNFINKRFQMYAQEVERLYDEEGYLPGKLYSAFYLTPLVPDPEPSFDLFEIMQFHMGLTTMIRSVYDKASIL
jgi:hypothetical protein